MRKNRCRQILKTAKLVTISQWRNERDAPVANGQRIKVTPAKLNPPKLAAC